MLTDSVTITVFEELGLSINNGEDEVIYCQGTNPLLSITFNVASDIEWFVDDITVGNGNQLENFFPEGNFDIIALGTDASGCSEADTISVRESIADGNISGPTQLCIGETITLDYNPSSITDFDINWTPSKGAVLSGTSATVSPTETTTYTAEYFNADMCGDTVAFTVLVGGFAEALDIFADPTEVCLSQTTELFIDAASDETVAWSPTETLDDPTSATPTATPTEDITYSVIVTDDLGCTIESSIDIAVVQPTCDERDVFIPNMFTPNDDDINDTFRVESAFLATSELVVYNRWGEEVFRSNEVDNGWDGTFGGSNLDPDVYGYYFSGTCVNGFTVQMQGNVTLIK